MKNLILLLLSLIVIFSIASFFFLPSSTRTAFGVGIITGLICETIILLCTELFKKIKTTIISVKSGDKSIASFTIVNNAITDFYTSGSSAVTYSIK